MTTILGLVGAALVLVFFEVLLPGGILGLGAAGCIIAATWIAGANHGFVTAATVFIGSLVAVLILIIEFKVFAKTRFGQRFFLTDKLTGHSSESQSDASIVGARGKTLTRLNPTGMVLIDGKRHEAFSRDGYLDSGNEVEVVDRDNFRLIIKKL